MALITVILPTCDRPALLPRAVASVLAQTEPDFELLVIDNNRGDPPLAGQSVAAGWRRDPRVQIIRPDAMRNAAVARNAGLAAARGAWVSYLDDDDTYRPDKLERQLALALTTGAPLVLCGATFHLRGRERAVQCDAPEWRGDDLILRARWNTPLLFHRHPGDARFDESLSPGEDAEFAHRLLARAGVPAVPVVPRPLVDIFPQPGPRVNVTAAPVRPAAARILAARRGFYSRGARRRYVLQTLLALAKLGRRPGRCTVLGWRLLRESRGADWRPCANALAVSLNLFPGRWVS
ncbi:MAG: glycosyltransferase family 2 protein [Verrucomicrobia bacterium]|nr:glycosyltransferase family 2 protein [Verrucomicrobiota bacterium]